MAEYINKEKLIETVKTIEFKYDISPRWQDERTESEKRRDWEKMYKICFQSTVEDFPVADVVEVVRCKDCKYYTSMIPSKNTGICSLASRHLGDDGFCSEGERREDDQPD